MSEDNQLARHLQGTPPILPTKHAGVTPEEWQYELDKDPEKVIEHTDNKGNKYQYMPISQMVRKLDDLTGGVWSHTEPNVQIFDSGFVDKYKQPTPIIIITIGLTYYNPVSRVTITRFGMADGLYYKGKAGLNLPALKSEAFKNAVREMGRALGRELNRKHQEDISVNDAITYWEDDIAAAKDYDELKNILAQAEPRLRKDKKFLEAFTKRKEELQKAGKKK